MRSWSALKIVSWRSNSRIDIFSHQVLESGFHATDSVLFAKKLTLKMDGLPDFGVRKKNKSSETSSVTKGHMALQNWPHFPQFRSHQFEENSGAQKMMCSSRRDGFLQSQTWWRSCGLITNPVNPPKKITTYGCWTKNRGVYPQNGWWK